MKNIINLINFQKYENKLKEYYEIKKNISLLILIYENISNTSSERNTQYEIFESLNSTKLNISICKDLLIDIYIFLSL